MQSRSPLANLVANELTRHAPAIAQEWVRHIERDDREAAASEELVTDLRHHGPELVKSIVEFMREPGDVSRADLVARLRLHADRRLARGYDIHQLLADFEHLSKLFFTSFADAVERRSSNPEPSRDVMRARSGRTPD